MTISEPDLEATRGVLFDLDGTLLQVEMGKFIPAYVSGLAGHFADRVAAEPFARTLLAGIRTLLAGTDATVSNEEQLLSLVERELGIAPDEFRARFRAFVDDGMARLRPLVRALPLARNILARCFARGMKVAIATNPVFPRALVDARLTWGGIDDFPFDLVTSVENSCCCKPQPGYFLEVAATLGLKPGECLMVGNDTEHDLAARQVGIPTFLVDTWLEDRCCGRYASDFRGGHTDLFRLLGRLGASC